MGDLRDFGGSFRNHHFIVGCDLGMAAEPTAIAVLEQVNEIRNRYEAECVEYRLRHVERRPLGEPTPATTDRLLELIKHVKSQEGDQQTDVVVGVTAAGRAPIAYMQERQIWPHEVIISAGQGEARTPSGVYRIGKRELVGSLQLSLQTGKLKVANEMPHREALVTELVNFKMKPPAVDPSDFDAWREGQHDDLVFATALAAWWGNRYVPGPPMPLEPKTYVDGW